MSTKKIVSLLLIFAVVLLPYGFSGISFGTLLIAIILIVIFSSGRINSFHFGNRYLPYFLYALIIPTLCVMVRYGINSFSIIDTMCLLSIAYIQYNYDEKVFLKFYRYLVFTCVIVYCCQEILYLAAGYRFSGLIPSLPLIYEGTVDVSMADFRLAQQESERASSIFLEAAQFAQVLLPFLCIELFSKEKISRTAIVLTVILLLLRSGNGLLLMSMIWLIRLLVYNPSKKKYFSLLLILPLITIAVKYYISMESSEILVERFNGIKNNIDNASHSGFIRIFRGYYLFDALPLFDKFFGLNSGSVLSAEVTKYPIYWLFQNDLYLNSFQSNLVYTGIIGTVLYYSWLLSYLKKVTICGKVIIMSFIFLNFIASLSFPMFLLYFISAITFKKQ